MEAATVELRAHKRRSEPGTRRAAAQLRHKGRPQPPQRDGASVAPQSRQTSPIVPTLRPAGQAGQNIQGAGLQVLGESAVGWVIQRV